MEVHPLQRFPSSETGRGLRQRNADEAATAVTMMEVKTERNRAESDEVSAPVSPSINLGLQIGTNSARSRNERASIVHRPRESLLTVGQLQELQQQALIHKYLAAGLRVPTHLLVPIWKSVAGTLGSGINERYRNFIGYSPGGFDYRSMMDPEPGRCRRTDGKKWRCSRNTVPHQKYCEGHMHRGRQRSRKPVEASENDSPSKKILLNNSDTDLLKQLPAACMEQQPLLPAVQMQLKPSELSLLVPQTPLLHVSQQFLALIQLPLPAFPLVT